MKEVTPLDQLWAEICRLESERWRLDEELSLARQRFVQAGPDSVAVLKSALARGERGPVVRTVQLLPEPDRRQFLPELVHLASMDTANLLPARRVVLSIERRWLAANVEPWIWVELGCEATYEQYRRLAELASEIDGGILARIVARALSLEDPDIREVGRDFQDARGGS